MDTSKRIRQILSKKSRHRPSCITLEDVQKHIDQLRLLIRNPTQAAAIAHEFVPIRLVTLIEALSREWLATLIDGDTRVRDQAAKIAKPIRFDYLLACAVNNRDITLGDVVAHDASLNSIADLVHAFETLLEKPFWQVLAAATDTEDDEDDPAVIPRYEAVIRDLAPFQATLARVFEVRHILTHELPNAPPTDAADCEAMIDAVEQFAHALDIAMRRTMWWGAAETLDQLIAVAEEDTVLHRQTITGVVERIIAEFPDRAALIGEAQQAWDQFMLINARLQAVRKHPARTAFRRQWQR